jgi:RNA polymerase sigma-B factor
VVRVDKAIDDLFRRAGRPPSVGEVAEAVDLSTEEVLEAMEAAIAHDAVSLELRRGGEDGERDTYAETLGVEEERYDLVEYGAAISPALRALSPRDRLILHLRFVEDLTQSKIAERVGVSQMHVSRLIRRALMRLRTIVNPRAG